MDWITLRLCSAYIGRAQTRPRQCHYQFALGTVRRIVPVRTSSHKTLMRTREAKLVGARRFMLMAGIVSPTTALEQRRSEHTHIGPDSSA